MTFKRVFFLMLIEMMLSHALELFMFIFHTALKVNHLGLEKR